MNIEFTPNKEYWIPGTSKLVEDEGGFRVQEKMGTLLDCENSKALRLECRMYRQQHIITY